MTATLLDISKKIDPHKEAVLSEILNRESDRDGGLRFVQHMQGYSSDRDKTIISDIDMLSAVRLGVLDKR